MKKEMSSEEANKIILKKICSLQKLTKKIKVDKNWVFIDKLFQLLKEIENFTLRDSSEENFDDEYNNYLKFYLNIQTNINLELYSDTTSGFQYGIFVFDKNENNEENRIWMDDEEELKD